MPKFDFATRVPVEDCLMSAQRYWPVSRVVLGDPGQEESEVCILLFLGAVLVGLPRTGPAMACATLKPRVQEDQQRLEL
jgi:hypothetical protein